MEKKEKKHTCSRFNNNNNEINIGYMEKNNEQKLNRLWNI